MLASEGLEEVVGGVVRVERTGRVGCRGRVT